jgi:predicted AlkP superfamily pyrophosphatase or phosphodiesterase
LKRNSGTQKYLIVISYDAFSKDNWELASSLPNLSELLRHGAFSNQLTSVYPSLTYVAHSTMVTGVYPDKHGVFHNNPFQPFVDESEQHWFWYRKDIKVPTIYDVVKAHGMKSAGILWPVTGKASITYNMPEIRAIGHENQAWKILKNGSPIYSLAMELKYGRYRKGISQPYLDDFSTFCAVDTIKRKKPNLLLLHLIDLDDAKHEAGTDSQEAREAVIRMDQRLGELMKAVREAGIYDQTVFLVIGDHSQMDVKYKVRLNMLLQDHKLIYQENGSWKWRAYFQSASGSAYLHVKENDLEAETIALELLKGAQAQYGIEAVFEKEELKTFHVSEEHRYMIEAKPGFCFADGLKGSVVQDLHEKKQRYATHGYSPNKPEYLSNVLIAGAGIKSEIDIGPIRMIDIAPTLAKILGIDFPDCDGRALHEIFIKQEL